MNRLLVIPLIVALLVPMFGIAEANPGAPDLQITNVSITVPDPAQPNKVHVEVTVANRGDAPAGSFAIRWYPHQASNEVGCSTDAPGLNAGKQGKLKCNYMYVGSGEMHWRAVVDEETEIAESNENNNTQTGVISIGGSPPPPSGGAYDLTVKRMDFYLPPFDIHETIEMHVLLATQTAPDGAPPFPATHFRWRKGQDTAWHEEACAADSHIGSCAKTITFSYERGGSHVVEVQVDNRNEVPESNENNNTGTYILTIGGEIPPSPADQPDLLILYPKFTPWPVVQGQPFTAEMLVKNNGGVDAAGPFIVLWMFPDGLGIDNCAWQFNSLPANSVSTVSCERTVHKHGEVSTSLTVDADNVVAESDEVNNDVTLKMTISQSPAGQQQPAPAKPDLLIEESHFEPAHPVPGQPFKAVMTVRNDSNVDVTQSFRGLWEFDQALGVADCKWTFGKGLKAGKKIVIDCERTSNANPAQYSTLPTVDADNVIAEQDEINNDKPTTLILYAADAPDGQGPSMPDLTIKNLRVAPAKAIPSQMLTISFDVVNQGAAAPPSKATWYSGVSNQQGHVRDIPALGAGATHHVDIADVPAPSMPGSYSHYAVADSASLVDEENENNNRLVGSENLVVMAQDHPDVQGPADLVIRNLRMTPNPVIHGHDFQVEFEVVNQGQGEAKKSVAEWHTPPGGGLSFRCDVPKLQKGASHKCSWQFMAAPAKKNYGTTATADVDNAVTESNENNNTLKETLQVK